MFYLSYSLFFLKTIPRTIIEISVKSNSNPGEVGVVGIVGIEGVVGIV